MCWDCRVLRGSRRRMVLAKTEFKIHAVCAAMHEGSAPACDETAMRGVAIYLSMSLEQVRPSAVCQQLSLGEQ
jgi:hypothetical protein